jgi:hypothetical protein
LDLSYSSTGSSSAGYSELAGHLDRHDSSSHSMEEWRLPRSICIYSGIIGPILSSVVPFVLGTLEPGYDPISQLLSELGDLPSALTCDILDIRYIYILGDQYIG